MRAVILNAVWALCLLAACSSKEEIPENGNNQTPIPIQLSVNCSNPSRVNDSGFEKNDAVGLYVVNYKGEAAGSLQSSGNHVDNMRFRYVDNLWTPDEEIFWKDETTPADFYAYYPYTTLLTDITAWDIQVNPNQAEENIYKSCDFLYGKVNKISPTEKAVKINVNHILSNMVITIKPGGGFTEEKLDTANIKVRVKGLKTQSSYNLSTGQLNSLKGESQTCTPWHTGKEYRLMVIPQQVPEQQFITVTIEGRDYNLVKGFTFEKGKRYQFPITVNKTSNGINVGVNPWEDDGTDHGGVAE